MLSVIVPTRNEERNVQPLVDHVARALEGTDWELIFVDDSDDATPAMVASMDLPQVRLVHREPPERAGGLAGAVCRGFEISRGTHLAVMDGDLQHDPKRLQDLTAALEHSDVAVASRFVEGGGGSAGLEGASRETVSYLTRVAVRGLFPRIRHVHDPLAGYFAIRRSVVEQTPMHPQGFKILLEILVRGRWQRVEEVPFTLGERAEGMSKADLREGWHFGKHVLRLRLGR
jgi:glycosyltransferase involved in cell wall biosynthesis